MMKLKLQLYITDNLIWEKLQFLIFCTDFAVSTKIKRNGEYQFTIPQPLKEENYMGLLIL